MRRLQPLRILFLSTNEEINGRKLNSGSAFLLIQRAWDNPSAFDWPAKTYILRKPITVGQIFTKVTELGALLYRQSIRRKIS
jgi:hypothetical protein